MSNHKVLISACFALLMFVLLVMGVRAQDAPRNDSPLALDAPQLTTIAFGSQAELQWLAAHVDVWSVDHAAKSVTALLTPTQIEVLRGNGYEVTPSAEQPMLRPLTAATLAGGDDGTIPGFACYRTVEKSFADLTALTVLHPELAQWVDIGDSWDKEAPNGPAGYDLRVLVLTNTQSDVPKGRFFLMSAIHARELTTAEIATRFAEYLLANYGRDPEVTWMLDYNEIHILPFANPDGRKWAEQLYYWRKNTNTTDSCTAPNTQEPWFPNYGVDLNRNSSFKWSECEGFGCSSAESCDLTFRGSGPASEPETQAIQAYVTSIFPDQRGSEITDAAPADTTGLLISLHSFSRLVLFPWGWTTTDAPNRTQLETLGRKFGYFTGYDVCQSGEPGCIYQTDGTTDDWSYGELGIASYTFELGTEFFQSCSYFEEEILTDTLSSLHYAVKAARQPYVTPSGPESLAVRLAPNIVTAGTAVTLTALANDTRFDSNGWGVEPTQTVTAAHYSIGAPSWITDTTRYTFTRNLPMSGVFEMVAADGNFDAAVEPVQAVINTDGWPVGRHHIFVESQDVTGTWGAPSAAFIDVVAELTYSATITVNNELAARPGSSVATQLLLQNTGSGADSYALEIDLLGPNNVAGWRVDAPSQIATLAPGQSTAVTITVTPPTTATVGTTGSLLLSATSQSSGQAVGPRQVEITVLPHQFVFPFAPQQ